MRHPFKVGGRYRNRRGEYEVIGLEEPKMMIRYLDGSVLETTVEIQARIWRNIQIEESRETPVRAPISRPGRRRQRGLEFQGLQEHDFQRGVAGTSWRARTSLGGLLAQRMSDATRDHFQSYAIYRRAEVHIAQPSYYDPSRSERDAKFAFDLDAQRARYGFYIEKNDGPMDDTWDWLRFLTALGGDTALQQEVETAMRQLKLHWEVYVWDEGGLIAQVKAAQEGLIWEWQSQDGLGDIAWSDFVSRLRAIETEKWCDLHLCTHMDKDRAIAAGIHIVDPVTTVYRALLPLYEASVQRAS